MSDLSTKPKPSFAPVYTAAMYPDLAQIFRDHGWALAVHGSVTRDLDLIAVPWVEKPSPPDGVLAAMKAAIQVDFIGGLKPKLHGRTVQTVCVGFGSCYLDLSFMPIVENEVTDGSAGVDVVCGNAGDVDSTDDQIEV